MMRQIEIGDGAMHAVRGACMHFTKVTYFTKKKKNTIFTKKYSPQNTLAVRTKLAERDIGIGNHT